MFTASLIVDLFSVCEAIICHHELAHIEYTTKTIVIEKAISLQMILLLSVFSTSVLFSGKVVLLQVIKIGASN